jgi:hypothetical protein
MPRAEPVEVTDATVRRRSDPEATADHERARARLDQRLRRDARTAVDADRRRPRVLVVGPRAAPEDVVARAVDDARVGRGMGAQDARGLDIHGVRELGRALAVGDVADARAVNDQARGLDLEQPGHRRFVVEIDAVRGAGRQRARLAIAEAGDRDPDAESVLEDRPAEHRARTEEQRRQRADGTRIRPG